MPINVDQRNQTPIRQLGQLGVITDTDPYDIPANAWTMGVNVRFRNSRVHTAPAFKNAYHLATANPRFMAAYIPQSGLDQIFIAYENGRVFFFNSASLTETDYSIAAYTNNTVEGAWTSCMLSNCIFINRPDRAPWSLIPAATQFTVLPNFPANTTCGLIRQAGGALVALDITTSGVNVPNQILTSSFAAPGVVPSSWDFTTPSTLATQNTLAEIEGPIQDAQNLGRDLVIYSNDQAWRMTLSGDQNIWNYYKLPFQKGSINANCTVQIASRHYVFGPTDIWVHDGVTEKSICTARVKDFIYGSINMSKANRCFVTYDQHQSEIHFNFVSGDSYLKFINTPDGCNRCAIYNYDNDTWSFDDRPLVYSGDWANLDSVLLWSTVTQTWATIQGSWQDQQDTQKRVTCYIGDVNATYNLTASLYANDPPTSTLPGAPPPVVSFPIDTHATGTPYLERNGIDLDQIVDLQGYKLINYVLPQGRIDPQSSQSIMFSLGAADGFNQTPTFTPYIAYDGGAVNYKLDFNEAGRFLFLKVQFNDVQMMTLSGIDLDVTETGER